MWLEKDKAKLLLCVGWIRKMVIFSKLTSYKQYYFLSFGIDIPVWICLYHLIHSRPMIPNDSEKLSAVISVLNSCVHQWTASKEMDSFHRRRQMQCSLTQPSFHSIPPPLSLLPVLPPPLYPFIFFFYSCCSSFAWQLVNNHQCSWKALWLTPNNNPGLNESIIVLP